jgi:iron complex outermembrane receptor protein
MVTVPFPGQSWLAQKPFAPETPSRKVREVLDGGEATLRFSVAHLVLALTAPSLGAAGASSTEGTRDITELTLEELSQIEVTSVSKREESLADAAAAISVISNETLRRSGATTIPEALRLAPGIYVAQGTSNIWGVSSRGFMSGNSPYLLVLSDTRSIYTPFFSGVFWDVQDVLLEDIDRIEVIRGPGASLWGSNAVNGVINITSKSAQQTQGAYFEGGGGTKERAFGAVRYGGKLTDEIWFRVFAKGVDRAGQFAPLGPARDNWKLGHLGFRADWKVDAKDSFTFQGDAYTGDIGQTTPSVSVGARPGPTGKLVAEVAGGNVLARWTHAFAPGSDVQVRAYYDGTHRDDPSFLDNLDTVDLDVQHRFQLPLRQEVIWGLDYRAMDNRNHGKGLLALDPPNSLDTVVSGFVQDQIAVLASIKVTLGTKLEHNDFSGWEVQPTARIAWSPSREATLWGSVSRAVRVPTRLERDVDIDVTDPAQNPLIRLLGNRGFGSEKLLAYELGYRWQIEKRLFIDLAGYYNVYHGLTSLEFDPAFVDPQTGRTIVPIVNKNLTNGVAKGGEAAVTLTPVRSWRLVANYAYVLLTLDPKGQDLNGGRYFEGRTPRNQFTLQSFVDLPAHFQLDALFRYTSSVPAATQLVPGQPIPAYGEIDVRAAWQWQRLEFSMVGRNLLHDHRREIPGGGEIERSVYLKVAGRF